MKKKRDTHTQTDTVKWSLERKMAKNMQTEQKKCINQHAMVNKEKGD